MKTILYNPIFINPQAYYVFPNLNGQLVEQKDATIEPAKYSGIIEVKVIANGDSKLIRYYSNTNKIDLSEFKDSWNGDVLTNKTVGGITLTADMIGKIQKFTIASEDVGKVIGLPIIYNSSSIKTWIEVLCNKAGATLIGNGAYSGASLCDGQADTRYAGVEGFSEWTMGTLKQRDDDGNDILPDVVFIYRGTNDMTHSMTKGGFARIDSYDIAMNGYPTTDEDDDSYSFRKAYIMTIKKIRDTYPNAKIYCCTLNIFKRITYDRFPTRNGYYSLPQINQCIREIADEMGCGLVELDKDGITFENCYPTYISDSETTPTHPNQTGHNVMAERAYRDTMGFNGLQKSLKTEVT